MTPTRNLSDPTRVLHGQELENGLKEPVYENIEVPEEFGPVDVLVDDLKIKRFAFVADDYGDWYLRGGSPWGGRIGQPGLLANDLLQLFTLRYAASQVVGLHTTEELWWQRPVRLGQQVRLSGRYVETYEHRGQGSVVLEADARDLDGNVLLRHRGVEIMRTAPAGVGGRGSTGGGIGGAPRVTGEYDRGRARIERLSPAVAPGTGLEPLRKEVTFEQMAVFSRLGEFVTNIHNDLRTAQAAGLTVPIVQGQQQVCYLAELCARAFGAAWFESGWLKVKFLRPISAFDVIEVAGAVREVEPEPHGDAAIGLDVWIRDGDGRLATVGWARAELRATEPSFTGRSGDLAARTRAEHGRRVPTDEALQGARNPGRS
jgi:acyl dehydratase